MSATTLELIPTGSGSVCCATLLSPLPSFLSPLSSIVSSLSKVPGLTSFHSLFLFFTFSPLLYFIFLFSLICSLFSSSHSFLIHHSFFICYLTHSLSFSNNVRGRARCQESFCCFPFSLLASPLLYLFIMQFLHALWVRTNSTPSAQP